MVKVSLYYLFFILSLIAGHKLHKSENHLINLPDISTFKIILNKPAHRHKTFIKGCSEAPSGTGTYQQFFDNRNKNVTVRCEMDFYGGGWTVLQRRGEGDLDFRMPWNDYKHGFGSIHKEFWFGLEKVYHMTQMENYELIVIMSNYKKQRGYALYKTFKIDSESKNFLLATLGVYSGTAGDSLKYHLNMPFSTYDHNNNNNDCSKLFWGGWWYNACYTSNLNGKYPNSQNELSTGCYRCISWTSFFMDRSPTFTIMMIRPTVKENWKH